MEEEISIVELINMFVRRWWIAVGAAIICAVMVFSYTEIFVAPTYASKGLLYVSNSQMNSKNSEITATQIQSARDLVETYSEVLKSETFLSMISEDTGGKYMPEEIKQMVNFSSVGETELMQINVISTNPHEAYEIANSVVNNSTGFLKELIGGDVKIVDPARESAIPVGPNTKKNTGIAALLGFAIGCAAIFCIEFFDTRIKSGAQLSDKFEVAILGEIPNLHPEE